MDNEEFSSHFPLDVLYRTTVSLSTLQTTAEAPAGTDDDDDDDDEGSLLTVVFVLIGIIGTFGNSLVCVVISSALRKKANTTNFLILNQAIVDLCTSVHLILLYTFRAGISKPRKGLWGEFLCRFWFSSTLLWMLFVVSTYNLVMLCLERFIAVALPLHYNSRVKRKSALYMILFCWLVAPFVHFYYPIFFDYVEDGHCKKHVELRSAAIMGFVIILWEFAVPFVLMSGMYVCIMAVLRHQQRRVHGDGKRQAVQGSRDVRKGGQMASLAVPSLNPVPLLNSSSLHLSSKTSDSKAQIIVTSEQTNEASTNSSSGQASSSQAREEPKQVTSSQRLRRNLTFTLLAVFVMFGLCWMPNHMTFFLFGIGKAQLGTTWHTFTLVLAYMNMSVNPFIYAWKYRQFQQGFRTIFCKSVCGRKSNGTEVVGFAFSRSSATFNNRDRGSANRKYDQGSPVNLQPVGVMADTSPPSNDLLSNDVVNDAIQPRSGKD